MRPASTDGTHTLTIAYTGTKNPAAAGAYIGVDAFDILGTIVQAGGPPPPPTPTRYQQTDTHLSFTGSWGTGLNPGASGGSWGYANTSGSLATVKFTGTSIGWITVKSPNYGIAQVTLDSDAPVTVDLYSPDTKWQQKVWSATGLHRRRPHPHHRLHRHQEPRCGWGLYRGRRLRHPGDDRLGACRGCHLGVRQSETIDRRARGWSAHAANESARDNRQVTAH